jgi:hypothetical protein
MTPAGDGAAATAVGVAAAWLLEGASRDPQADTVAASAAIAIVRFIRANVIMGDLFMRE